MTLRLESYPRSCGFCDKANEFARVVAELIVSGLVVGVVVVFDEGDGADYVVGDGLGAGELQGGAHGGALPDGGGADGVGGSCLGPGGEEFVDDGLCGRRAGR